MKAVNVETVFLNLYFFMFFFKIMFKEKENYLGGWIHICQYIQLISQNFTVTSLFK